MILMGLLDRTAIQIVHKIRKGTALHCASGLEGKSLTLHIGECPITHIGLITAFLGTNIAIILIGHSLVEDTETLATLAVHIVLVGALSVIGNLVVFAGKYPLHAETEQLGLLLGILVHLHAFIHDEFAIGCEGVGHGEGGLYRGHIIYHLNSLSWDNILYGYTLNLAYGTLPCRKLVLEICTIVIIGGSTPEVGCN